MLRSFFLGASLLFACVACASATQLPVGPAPYYIVAAELNGDGKPDLITANTSSNDVTVLINQTP